MTPDYVAASLLGGGHRFRQYQLPTLFRVLSAAARVCWRMNITGPRSLARGHAAYPADAKEPHLVRLVRVASCQDAKTLRTVTLRTPSELTCRVAIEPAIMSIRHDYGSCNSQQPTQVPDWA